MLLAPLLLLGTAPATAQEPWSPLPLPGLSRPSAVAPLPPELEDGVHLRPLDDELPPAAAPGAPLPPATLLAVLEEELARRRLAGDVELAGGQLLVRGAEALGPARAVLAGLEPWDAALAVELDARLAPAGGAGEGAHGWTTRVRAGERAALGTRQRLPYLGDYDVNVATDSAVAEPDTLEAHVGATLHVTVHRLAGGRRVLLEGLLDLSEVLAVATFDPDTPDLGLLEEPEVAFAQVGFAAAVPSGAPVRVELRGLPLRQPDWDLVLTAAARPDPEPTAGAWAVLDVSALTAPASGRPAPDLGDVPAPREPVETLPSGTLARLLEGEGWGTALQWSERLLLLPADDAPRLAAARALLASLEGALAGGGTLDVGGGETRVRLPLVSARPWRVLVGRERRRVLDYRTQIAAETWMAQPELVRVVDGFGVNGGRSGASVWGSAWTLAALDGADLEARAAGVGRLQRVERRHAAGTFTARAGDPVEVLSAGPSGGPVTLSLALD